jgi:hypothetical protein
LSSKATREAEIDRTVVPGQPEKNVCENASQWKKLGMVVCACHPSYYRNHKIGRSYSRPAWAKSETVSKIPEQKGLKV